MVNRFCAICGKSLSDEDPHFGLCLLCYLKENPLFELPKKFSLNICLDCGSFSKKEDWVEPTDQDLFSIIEEGIKKFLLKPLKTMKNVKFFISFNRDSFIYSSKDLLISLEVKIRGVLRENLNINHQENIKLNLRYSLCKNCTNLRSGTYYLSIVQLRVNDESQLDLLKQILNNINTMVENIFEKDHRHYISKIEVQKYGFDLYLSTNELMKYILKALKARYQFLLKRTKKLVGRDSQKGRNIYRLKSLIKLLPIKNSDVIRINNQKYIVENITKNKIILRDENNSKLIKDYSYFFNEKFEKVQ